MNMANSKKLSEKKLLNNSNMKRLDKKAATRLVVIRLLIIILFDLAIGFGLNYLRTCDMMITLNFHQNVLPVLRYVFAGVVLLAAAYVVMMIIKKVDSSAHVVTPLMIFAFAMILAITAAFFDRFQSAPYLYWIMAILVGVFFAVYYIYTILMYKK